MNSYKKLDKIRKKHIFVKCTILKSHTKESPIEFLFTADLEICDSYKIRC